ncbi:antitoxin [Streptomyces sp. NPDC048664]|uniref:antitoxin n=1 Tax=Streptomyces sp. NPDC048664 TaxID=3154505 RepID=UPI00342F7423
MSMMDKLKRMLKGHEDQARETADTARDRRDDTVRGGPGRPVDKGPDALRDQMRSPQDRDNPPRP